MRHCSLIASDHRELLTRLVDIAGSIPEGKGQLARAYFKLSILHDENGKENESNICKVLAAQLMMELRPGAPGTSCTEEDYGKLCVWMLW